jgi:DNA end-binding protein Ku
MAALRASVDRARSARGEPASTEPTPITSARSARKTTPAKERAGKKTPATKRTSRGATKTASKAASKDTGEPRAKSSARSAKKTSAKKPSTRRSA